MLTAEGDLAWQIGQSSGAWERAGMSGAIVGLNWPAALALAAAFDPDAESIITTPLLQALEDGALAGAAEQRLSEE